MASSRLRSRNTERFFAEATSEYGRLGMEQVKKRLSLISYVRCAAVGTWTIARFSLRKETHCVFFSGWGKKKKVARHLTPTSTKRA